MNLSDPQDVLYDHAEDYTSRGTEHNDLYPRPYVHDFDTYKPGSMMEGWRNTQIGGTHYADLAIQPGEYALANNLNYWQGNVIKYVTRYREKGGKQDLDKAIHCLQMLKEAEYGRPRDMPKAHSKSRI